MPPYSRWKADVSKAFRRAAPTSLVRAAGALAVFPTCFTRHSWELTAPVLNGAGPGLVAWCINVAHDATGIERLVLLRSTVVFGLYTGASLGQRAFFHSPADHRRREQVLRASSVRSVLVCGLSNERPILFLMLFGTVDAFAAALITPRGFGCMVTSVPTGDQRVVYLASRTSTDSETAMIGQAVTASWIPVPT
ncbi:hypothetical protein [Brevibacterium gallinarum]|uniref:Uncharacterized protein n=1 Tax=Brevibacterium gallinarum TaxID=2762220 RepID=A0ABR8WWM0_9MICO|nr:hypothetical protein [Brevibacterium gallinarum]MBD8021363.1 hypothetical protein [Brevibacterium gallinarum]